MTQEQAKHSSLYFLYEFEEERKEKCFKFIEELFTDFKLELEAEYQRGQEDVLSRTCEGCEHFVPDKSEDGTDGYCRIIRMATTLEGGEEGVFLGRYNSSSCSDWEQK